MTQAHDVEDLATDQIGEAFYWKMPAGQIEALSGVAVPVRTLWRNLPAEVRGVFRERAERFMAGDLTMLPWTWPIGMPGEARG